MVQALHEEEMSLRGIAEPEAQQNAPARFALRIAGRRETVHTREDEVANGAASVKAMRSDDMQNNQTSVPFDAVTDYLLEQIIGGDDHCCC